MRGNKLDDLKNNINNAEDRTRLIRGRRSLRSDAICALRLLHCV